MNSPGPPVRGGNNERPARQANVTEWFERAGQLFRVSLLKCLPLATVAILCSEVPNLYWIASGHDLVHGPPANRLYWMLYIIAAVAAVYVASAVMLQQRSVVLGVAFEAGTALAEAGQRLPMLLLTWLLAWASLLVPLVLLQTWLRPAVAILLLSVPALFLLVCYVLLLLPVVLFERQNPYRALVRCVLLVRPYWWKVLAAVVIAVLVVLIGVIACAAVLDVLATVLAGDGPAFQAIVAAGSVAIGAVALSFLNALALTLHSALASSSA